MNPGLPAAETAFGEAFLFCVRPLRKTQNQPGVWGTGHTVSASDKIFKIRVYFSQHLLLLGIYDTLLRGKKLEIYRLISTSSGAAYLTFECPTTEQLYMN